MTQNGKELTSEHNKPHQFLSSPNYLSRQALNLGNLGEHGLTLSRSRQQGRSTTYRTRTHIKVVCKGFIPARPKLQSASRRLHTSEEAVLPA